MQQLAPLALTLIASAAVLLLLRSRRTQRRSSQARMHIFHDGDLAADVADQLRRGTAARLDGSVLADTLECFEGAVDSLRMADTLAVLIVTTGEDGEVNELAEACLKFLALKTNATRLCGIRFAVLGLGDSNLLATSHRSISWASGRDCNQGGELFDRWLEQTGGRRLVRRGESDARTDHDALGPWMETLWATLCT